MVRGMMADLVCNFCVIGRFISALRHPHVDVTTFAGG